MISLPIWLFVFLCVLAGITATFIALLVFCVIFSIFSGIKEEKKAEQDTKCPYKIERD